MNVAYRVSRERYHPQRHFLKVPNHMKLTGMQIMGGVLGFFIRPFQITK